MNNVALIEQYILIKLPILPYIYSYYLTSHLCCSATWWNHIPPAILDYTYVNNNINSAALAQHYYFFLLRSIVV